MGMDVPVCLRNPSTGAIWSRGTDVMEQVTPRGSRQHSQDRDVIAARMGRDGHGPSHGDLGTPGNRSSCHETPRHQQGWEL